jgi:hypothetical protein
MTNREKQLKSMLNYYGIDMLPVKDEKMTKKDQKNFLDTFNRNYDVYAVQDILKKVRDKLKDKLDNPEENDDPFFKNLKKDEELDDNTSFPLDMNSLSKFRHPLDNSEMQNFGFMNVNPEIEKFITWVSDLLYSADHKVVISEEGANITHIRLEKIKKKRGGRKK